MMFQKRFLILLQLPLIFRAQLCPSFLQMILLTLLQVIPRSKPLNYFLKNTHLLHFQGEITIASWKKVLPPSQGVFANAIPAIDIFSESRKTGEWRTASNVLIDNRNDDTVTSYSGRTSPTTFEVIFDRKNTIAYGGTSPTQGRNYVYSYLNMSVTMREAK